MTLLKLSGWIVASSPVWVFFIILIIQSLRGDKDALGCLKGVTVFILGSIGICLYLGVWGWLLC